MIEKCNGSGERCVLEYESRLKGEFENKNGGERVQNLCWYFIKTKLR